MGVCGSKIPSKTIDRYIIEREISNYLLRKRARPYQNYTIREYIAIFNSAHEDIYKLRRLASNGNFYGYDVGYFLQV